MENLKLESIILILVLGIFNACSGDESSSTSEMKLAPVQGGELGYEIRGDDEPILLIHGSHIAASFLPVMDEPALADYQLIRYHRRGFAGSTKHNGPFSIEEQAADALAMLQHLGVEQAHIVGHSYGGVIALQLALDAPEVVHSLSLLEQAILPPDTLVLPEQMQTAIEHYHAGDSAEAVDLFLKMVGGPEWRTELARTVPGGAEQAERDARTFFEIEVSALQQWEFDTGKTEKILQPTLIIHSPSWTERNPIVREWFPEAEYHRIEDVTHSLQMEDPQAVAEGIADFLKRHPM